MQMDQIIQLAYTEGVRKRKNNYRRQVNTMKWSARKSTRWQLCMCARHETYGRRLVWGEMTFKLVILNFHQETILC